MKRWTRKDKRPFSNVFICPECKREVYCIHIETGFDGRKTNICDYLYCPRCGMKVERSDYPIER